MVFRSVCKLFLLLGRPKGPSSSTIVLIFQLPWLCFLSHVITRSKQLDSLGKISQLLLCHIVNFWPATCICKILEFKDARLLEEIPNSVTSIKLSRIKHPKIVPFVCPLEVCQFSFLSFCNKLWDQLSFIKKKLYFIFFWILLHLSWSVN